MNKKKDECCQQCSFIICLDTFLDDFSFFSVSSPGCSHHQNGLKMALVISGLSVLFGLLALPTANFADIVKSEGKRYCEISIPGDTPQEAQINISVYYLFYSSILSYWLPLMVGSI